MLTYFLIKICQDPCWLWLILIRIVRPLLVNNMEIDIRVGLASYSLIHSNLYKYIMLKIVCTKQLQNIIASCTATKISPYRKYMIFS